MHFIVAPPRSFVGCWLAFAGMHHMLPPAPSAQIVISIWSVSRDSIMLA